MKGTVEASGPAGAGRSEVAAGIALADLAAAMQRLQGRGVLSAEQASAVLSEVEAAAAPTVVGAARGRRRLGQVLIEVGLYVGSALVIAALVALVAQSWEGMTQATRLASLGAVAVLCAILGLSLAHGAAFATARRRLAGVFLVGTASASAGIVALLGQDWQYVGTASLAVGLLVVVGAQLRAASAVTEIAMFVASFALVQFLVTELPSAPPGPTVVDEWGSTYVEPSLAELLQPLSFVAFGLVWGLLVSRTLVHRELAVVLGLLAAVMGGISVASPDETRVVGIAVLAGLAALGFWRYMAEAFWPWLACAIVSLTVMVFRLVGPAHRPALALLAAGLAMLASSAVAMQWGRRRRRRAGLGPMPTHEDLGPSAPPPTGGPQG